MISNSGSYIAVLGPGWVPFDGRIVVVVRTLGVVLFIEDRLKPSANLIVGLSFFWWVPLGLHVSIPTFKLIRFQANVLHRFPEPTISLFSAIVNDPSNGFLPFKRLSSCFSVDGLLNYFKFSVRSERSCGPSYANLIR